MRIALVTDTFYPATDGATTTTLKAIADRLIETGHDVRFIAPGPGLPTYNRSRVVRINPVAKPGGQTAGRDAIRRLWAKVLAERPHFEPEEPLPTLRSGDLALTATARKDGVGVRVQVARRQADGTWLRVLDQPELAPPGAEAR